MLLIVEVSPGVVVILNNVTSIQGAADGGARVHFGMSDPVDLNPEQAHVLRKAGINFQDRHSAHVYSAADAGPMPAAKKAAEEK